MDLDIPDRAGVGAMKRPSLMPITDPALKRVFTDILNELEALSERVGKVINDQGVFVGELPAGTVTATSIASAAIRGSHMGDEVAAEFVDNMNSSYTEAEWDTEMEA